MRVSSAEQVSLSRGAAWQISNVLFLDVELLSSGDLGDSRRAEKE
jgi:hypothetical protein